MDGAKVAVVGGGLGGLTCAALLARRGADVTVFEGSAEPGGMAATQVRDGYRWNWGGHALYRKGAGVAILRSLGVQPRGAHIRGASFMRVMRDRQLLPAPFSPSGTLSSALSTRDRLELAKVYAVLGATSRGDLGEVTIGAWIDNQVQRPRVREVLLALVRLSSFGHAPERQSADAALHQLWISLSGVWYLHDGWSQLVDGLRRAAEEAGVTLVTGARVVGVEHDEAVRAVRLGDGTSIAADAAVVAVGGPRAAARVLDGPASGTVKGWGDRAAPVRAATWELSLRRALPGDVWVLGLDTPVYANVHSHFARVAPDGAAMVHVVRYLGPEQPASSHRSEMENTLDLMIPGWREEVVDDRFLPALTVAHDLPLADNGGVAGRPGPLVPQVQGLAVVGDWVGHQGVLADATLASAASAAHALSAASAPMPARV